MSDTLIFPPPAATSLDSQVSAGLNAADHSLGYRIAEIETHLHSVGQFWGKSGVDNFLEENSHTPWRLTAGTSNAFGVWVQLSNGDEITDPHYDPHLIGVKASSSTTDSYIIQLGEGESGSQAIVASAWFQSRATLRSSPLVAQSKVISSSSKLWARCNCSSDSETIDIIMGTHSYPG